MKAIIKLILILYCSNVGAAFHFEIVPENPVEGQMVRLYYIGCGPAVPNIATGELYYLEWQENNLINFIGSYGFDIPLCPIFFEYYYDIGQLSNGNYQIDVYDTLSIVPFPIDTNNSIPSRTINFIVSKPIVIPSQNWISILSLFILVIFTTKFFSKFGD